MLADPISLPPRTPALAAVLAPPRRTNKGRRFPPDPPPVEDIVRLLNACVPLTPGRPGELCAMRLRALIAVMFDRIGHRRPPMMLVPGR